MAIVVIEGGRPDGMDLVMPAKKKPARLSRYVDFTEFSPGTADRKGIDMRASKAGVTIAGQYRLMGVHQARTLAKILCRAADEAEKRGAPKHVMRWIGG